MVKRFGAKPSEINADLHIFSGSRSPRAAMSISRPAMLSCNESGCILSCISLQALSKASPMMPIVSASKDRSKISRFLIAMRNGRNGAIVTLLAAVLAGAQASLAINPPQSLHCKLGKAVRYCSHEPSVRGRQGEERKPSGFSEATPHIAWQRRAATPITCGQSASQGKLFSSSRTAANCLIQIKANYGDLSTVKLISPKSVLVLPRA